MNTGHSRVQPAMWFRPPSPPLPMWRPVVDFPSSPSCMDTHISALLIYVLLWPAGWKKNEHDYDKYDNKLKGSKFYSLIISGGHTSTIIYICLSYHQLDSFSLDNHRNLLTRYIPYPTPELPYLVSIGSAHAHACIKTTTRKYGVCSNVNYSSNLTIFNDTEPNSDTIPHNCTIYQKSLQWINISVKIRKRWF